MSDMPLDVNEIAAYLLENVPQFQKLQEKKKVRIGRQMAFLLGQYFFQKLTEWKKEQDNPPKLIVPKT